jgi:hypothetical protein
VEESRFAPVDVDHDFQTDDCVRFEVESNYSGSFYVFSRGSSGEWRPLFPVQTPGENNDLAARGKVLVPAKHCFTLDPPSGIERIFLVLGRDKDELRELNESIELNVTAGHRTSSLASSDRVFDDLSLRLRDRDVGVRKVERRIVPGETDYSVYVVSMSDQPVSLLVAELRLRH